MTFIRGFTIRLLTFLVALGTASCSGTSSDAGGTPGGPGVSVQPPLAYVQTGGLQSFAATVTGLANTSVTWTVQESGGGSVSNTGLYSAPGTTGTFHIVATSVGNPSISGSATAVVSDVAPSGIIPADRRTAWNPGVPGGVPDSSAFTVHTTVALGASAGANTTAINGAIQAAGAVATAGSPRVVQLPAGIYHVNGQLNLDQDYVVLRGAGPDPGGSGAGTRIIMDAVNTDFIFMGAYTSWTASAVNVVGSIPKGASTFTLASASTFQVGDLIIIDMLDDATVQLEGGTWWKRSNTNTDNGPPSSGYRSRGQVAEITAISGNDVTIRGMLHRAYPSSQVPQVFRSSDRRQGWKGIGLESMTITGWGDAMGVYANLLNGCWIKSVEFDGRPTSQGAGFGPGTGYGTGTQGNDLRVFRSVRFTIEHSYLHHSRIYITNNEAYSISLAEQTSDTLVQDNIVWFKNKNIVLEASGGGNVIAYNYVEDPVIADSGSSYRTDWMEMCMDGSHLSYPTMDLFEGNHTAKMGAAETHGNAGEQTFFRNYSKGDRRYATLGSGSASIAAVMLNRYMHNMNFVGNVLSTKAGGIYEPNWSGDMVPSGEISTPKIWSIGLDGYNGNWGGPRDPIVQAELLRVANFDTVRNQVDQTPAEALTDSLYLPGKPAFFGAYAWPWVNPFGATAADRVKTLPARARFDAGTFF